MARNRTRKHSKIFYMTDEEKEIIKEKFLLSGQANMESFIRKMLLTGYVVQLDVKPIDEISSLLRICSNNLNQIANRMNSYEYVGESDIRFIRDLHTKLWELILEFVGKMAEL